MKRMSLPCVLSVVILALPAWTAGRDKPTGQEITGKAKQAKFDTTNAATGEKGGKKIKLTPADLSHVKSEAELQEGQVIGLLETEAAGDETRLSPGKYNLFMAKVGADWHVYAESSGQIAGEAVRVRFERMNEKPSSMKPQFRKQGWCFWVPMRCTWWEMGMTYDCLIWMCW